MIPDCIGDYGDGFDGGFGDDTWLKMLYLHSYYLNLWDNIKWQECQTEFKEVTYAMLILYRASYFFLISFDLVWNSLIQLRIENSN